jgi:phage tail-like protein
MARSASFDTVENFRFQVSLLDAAGQPTLQRAGFTTCTPPSESTGEITYREGQYRDAMEKSAGITTYNNVTLSRGVTQDQDFYSWVEQHKKHASNVRGSDGAFTASDARPSDDASNDYRRTLVVTVLGRDSQPVKQWTLYNCHVASFTPGDSLDAASEAKLMTSVELRYEGYEERTF